MKKYLMIMVLATMFGCIDTQVTCTGINNDIQNRQLKGLGCLFLLLTPVSWKHVVTIPYQAEMPIMNTPAEEFIKGYNKKDFYKNRLRWNNNCSQLISDISNQ